MSEQVPKSWEVCKLEERLYRPLAYGVLKPDSYVEDGVPMLRIQDVSVSGLNKRKLHRISEKLHQEFKRTELREGDLVMSLVGTIGRVLEITKNLEGANVSRAFGVIGLKDDIDRNYVRQFLTSQKIQDWIQDQAQGNAQKVLNLGELRNLSIIYPPLPEQKKIASILTSVDEVIEKTQSQIDKLQDLKKGTMNELLTKGIGHTEFKDSELGRIPKSWEVKQIGSYLHEFGKKSLENDEHEVFTSSSKGLMKQSDYYGENRLTRRENIGFNIIPRDYITYRSRSDSNAFFFNQNNLGMIGLVSKYYPVFSSKTGIEYNKFLVFILNFNSQKFANESVGTSQVVLSFNALKTVKLALPPLEEQIEITKILQGLEQNLDAALKKLHQTQSLKKSLMQDLLTGKVRVSVN